jgi:5-methylcytosine-specific restriction protein A
MKIYYADGKVVSNVARSAFLPKMEEMPLEAPVALWTMVEDDGRIITPGNAPCDAAYGMPRAGGWRTARTRHLEANPFCLACGAVKGLNVHHEKPFHLFPHLELDPDNLVTLCESPSHNCHFFLGHLLDWRSWNVDVRKLAAMIRELIKGRPL